MGLYKILKIVAFVLGALGSVALANLLIKGDALVIETGEGLDWFLNLSYITFALTIAFVLFFVLKGVITSDNIKMILISLGLLLVIVLISYGIADGESIVMPDGDVLSESGSRWISAGLNAFYILGVGAIVVMLISEFKNLTISK